MFVPPRGRPMKCSCRVVSLQKSAQTTGRRPQIVYCKTHERALKLRDCLEELLGMAVGSHPAFRRAQLLLKEVREDE
jgi:hypothetical protein